MFSVSIALYVHSQSCKWS